MMRMMKGQEKELDGQYTSVRCQSTLTRSNPPWNHKTYQPNKSHFYIISTLLVEMYHIVRKGKKHKVIIIRGAGIQMMRMMEEQEKEQLRMSALLADIPSN